MRVRCNNKNCLHVWDYRGSSSEYHDRITCPSCHFRILLRKALISGKVKETPTPSKKPSVKAIRRPVIEEKPEVGVLPPSIGGVDMYDGKVLSKDELPALRE